MGAFYLGVCVWQNRAYRVRLRHQLRSNLDAHGADAPLWEGWRITLAAIAPALNEETLELTAKAFATGDTELRSLAQVMLCEQLPHDLASAIGRATLEPNGG